MLSPTVSVAASSYLPVNDEEVLETLPRSLVSGRDELTRLRQMLSNDPGNAKLSARLAERYLDLGRQGNDPRFFGYARAVIGKWWNDSDAPPAILRLRAKLKEKDHRYRQALADLLRLLQSRPDDIQALIELANIYRVQGRYPESKKTCDALATVAGPLPTQVCLIPLLAVTGRAHTAYAMATEIVSESSREQLRIRQWALTMTAVIAQALGQTVRAEHHYREALVSDPTDTYLLRGFADFLLDQERANEVVPLLRAHTGDNGVLLRAAIAARRIGQIELARRWQSQLETRFAEIRLRGALTHRRFESRYALELKGDPQRALTLALLNWERQKETRDSRNVLAAAIALADPAASRAVRDFLAHHGTQDITLQQLIP